MSLSSIADAANAISRLQDVFTAELLQDTRTIDRSLPVAVRVRDAAFIWDGAAPEEVTKKGKKKDKHAAEEKETEERIFGLKGVNFEVPRGQVCSLRNFAGLLCDSDRVCGCDSFVRLLDL